MKMVGMLAELMAKTNPKLLPTVCDTRKKKNQCFIYDCRRHYMA